MTVPSTGASRSADGAVTPPAALSRRAVLGAAAAGTVGLLAGRLAGSVSFPTAPARSTQADPPDAALSTYPFYGPHQSGVATPAQDHLQFAAFDMVDGTSREDVAALLRDWSDAAARLTAGLSLAQPGGDDDPDAPPIDTGEALGLATRRLTVSFGLGPALFERDGEDRYGLAAARPAELEPLPPFAGDALETRWSDGDLCVQACADDPVVAFHAVRNLSRIAAERAAIRWTQAGFLRSTGTSTHDASTRGTPRNLLGFKDGTDNLRRDDQAVLDRHVWLEATSRPAWLAAGTYLVVRRIALLIEDWDREAIGSQESIFGRRKASGAPLSGGDETTPLDLGAMVDGAPVIDPAAHVRLAHPDANDGIRILRRGYNYVDGVDADGRLDAGLLFISFQRSPSGFIAIQRRLADDKLAKYVRHVGSAVFAMPPGTTRGGFVGDTLFA